MQKRILILLSRHWRAHESMSRTDKLYETLASMESRFLKMVSQEFERSWSSYLRRKDAIFGEGKSWRDARTAELERLEKDIVTLRERLGEPMAESAVAVVQEYVAKRAAAKDRHDGGDAHLRKEALLKLERMVR